MALGTVLEPPVHHSSVCRPVCSPGCRLVCLPTCLLNCLPMSLPCLVCLATIPLCPSAWSRQYGRNGPPSGLLREEFPHLSSTCLQPPYPRAPSQASALYPARLLRALGEPPPHTGYTDPPLELGRGSGTCEVVGCLSCPAPHAPGRAPSPHPISLAAPWKPELLPREIPETQQLAHRAPSEAGQRIKSPSQARPGRAAALGSQRPSSLCQRRPGPHWPLAGRAIPGGAGRLQ